MNDNNSEPSEVGGPGEVLIAEQPSHIQPMTTVVTDASIPQNIDLLGPRKKRRMSLKNAKTEEEEDEVVQLEEFIKDSVVVMPPVSESRGEPLNGGVPVQFESVSEVLPLGDNDTLRGKDLDVPVTSSSSPLVNGSGVQSTKVVFLFTGQGAQWHGMGASLLQASSPNVFTTSIEKTSSILQDLGSTINASTLLASNDHETDIHHGYFAIPITVALQIALVDLLTKVGLSPNIVLGHSTGEIAAAYAAGGLTHEDAIKIAFDYSNILSKHGRFGEHSGMLVIGLPEKNVAACITRMKNKSVVVACVNSPRNTTVSGEVAGLHELKEALDEAEVFCRILQINAAYHSKQMEIIRGKSTLAASHGAKVPSDDVTFYSSITGKVLETIISSYWEDNMISTVDFNAAVRTLLKDTLATKLVFVELSPQPHLQRLTMQILEAAKVEDGSFEYLPTFTHGNDAINDILNLSNKLASHGIHLDIKDIEEQKSERLSLGHDLHNAAIPSHQINENGCSIPSPFLQADEQLLEIYSDLSNYLSTLITLPTRTTLLRTLADSGLDSYLAMLFKSWISQKYNATLSVQQMLDAKSIFSLAYLVLEAIGSSRIIDGLSAKASEELKNGALVEASNSDGIEAKFTTETATEIRLPKFPLPELDSTLEEYYTSVEVFGNEEELAHTRKVIGDFKRPENGQKLQNRLLERVHNPKLDCWLADLYNNSNFLDRNGPLIPFGSFFYTHKLCNLEQTQAERAAIITAAAFEYKLLLDKGLIAPAELNGQPTDMFLFKYLFNTSRLPRMGSDIMERFPGNDHVVVLRRNRVFKVSLRNESTKTSYEKLKGIFDWILDTAQDNGPDVGILTTDDRNVWAKNREALRTSSAQNTDFLRVLEAAAFIVCLDDASPEGAPERARHFHFGSGSNRWNDKSVQFVICKNAVSGFIGDHSMLDAGTVLGLNNYVYKAIKEHNHSESLGILNGDCAHNVEEYRVSVTPELEHEIVRMGEDFRRHTAGIAHAFTTYRTFGASLPRSLKCPPKSYFQLVVILASRYHFGYNSALWETVSLGNFHKGRVEINQVIRPCIVELCSLADDPSVPLSRKRELLFESVKVHTSSVMRAVRGRGIDRHITSLRQMVREGEEVPAFFADPVYARSRPRKIMSHCHETGMAEKGFVLRDADAIWVHYEVEEESVHFSVTGVDEAPRVFCELIERAAESLRRILLGTEQ